MKYGQIAGTDKKISRIMYGTAVAPALTGQNCNELFDRVYEMGITAFDTARDYGLAEQSLGLWLAERDVREEIVILSKCGHPDANWNSRVNEREMRKDLEKSMELLHTDYIDIYLLHRDNPAMDAGVIVEVFNAMHAEGKIRAFGGSNWTHKRLEAANEYAYKHNLLPFTVSSPYFGLAEQSEDPWGGDCIGIAGRAGVEARAWYENNQMPVVAYSSLGRGLFSGRFKSDQPERAREVMDEFAQKGYLYPDNLLRLHRCEELAAEKICTVTQLALAWIFHQKLNIYAVLSSASADRMAQNIAALDIRLTDVECQYLNLERKER